VTVRRIVPDLYTADRQASRRFFVDGIGLGVAMDLPFITTFASPLSPEVQISVLTADPTGLAPDYSIEVDDADACAARMAALGCEIVYPLTNEPWGVRRFFVRDPAGKLANVLSHR
jgi:catechol 2,3-dioxygenase-like lactoylglutathione lyase family enzyme